MSFYPRFEDAKRPQRLQSSLAALKFIMAREKRGKMGMMAKIARRTTSVGGNNIGQRLFEKSHGLLHKTPPSVLSCVSPKLASSFIASLMSISSEHSERCILILRGDKKVQQVCVRGSREETERNGTEEVEALRQTQFYAQMEGRGEWKSVGSWVNHVARARTHSLRMGE